MDYKKNDDINVKYEDLEKMKAIPQNAPGIDKALSQRILRNEIYQLYIQGQSRNMIIQKLNIPPYTFDKVSKKIRAKLCEELDNEQNSMDLKVRLEGLYAKAFAKEDYGLAHKILSTMNDVVKGKSNHIFIEQEQNAEETGNSETEEPEAL